MYALDTNTVIHFFKGIERVTERLLSVAPFEVGIPSIVLFELTVGVLGSKAPRKRRRQLDTLLASTTVLPFGRAEAAASAEIRQILEAAGMPIGPLDTLIAGTAKANGATLVTRNVREFSRIRGLAIENWHDGDADDDIR